MYSIPSLFHILFYTFSVINPVIVSSACIGKKIDHQRVFQKCCSVNTTFNEGLASCSPFNETVLQIYPEITFGNNESLDVQLLKFFLNNVDSTEYNLGDPPYKTGVPTCDDCSEVLVNYKMTSDQFRSLHTRIIPQKTPGGRNLMRFCIDSVAAETYEDLSTLSWIIRVCRPKSVCTEIPCVRKCCAPNEMMTKYEAFSSSGCTPYEKDLSMTFYDTNGMLPWDIPVQQSKPGDTIN